jgi:tRNA U34 5-carboxymethylaminomethyl modifying enzyme MnmG/GidA
VSFVSNITPFPPAGRGFIFSAPEFYFLRISIYENGLNSSLPPPVEKVNPKILQNLQGFTKFALDFRIVSTLCGIFPRKKASKIKI